MIFTGKTKNLAVIGSPIGHSLSPAMQNAAIRAAGLDYAYVALPVLPERLEDSVRGLRALGFRGFNVTIPHKSAILPLLDEADEVARAIGAVNTVVCEAGRLKGFNTDVEGFLGALAARGFSVEGKRVVLLGAGGAARAALYGLLHSGAAGVTLGVRNAPKARPLAEEFAQYGEVCALDWNEAAFEEAVRKAALVVNTTPLGMAPQTQAMPPVPWQAVHERMFFYDIIYTPARTQFLRRAESLGCPTLNGEAMLVGQGAAAFRLWTGREADFAVMTHALREALEGKEKQAAKNEAETK